jgi:hypothetical protein
MRCSVFVLGLAVATATLAPAAVARAQYPLVQDLSPRQREDLAAAIKEYADDSVVDAHARTIDIYRPGHGEWFLRETRGATRALSAFLTGRGIVLAAWDPQTPIPPELAIVRSDAMGRPRPPLVNLNPQMPISRYLPPGGLSSFHSPRELGEALLPWHNAVHHTVGGSMADIRFAAATPIFWCWHAYIDNIFTDWEKIAPPPGLQKVVKLVPNPPLPGVTVEFINTHTEDLSIEIVDRRDRAARPAGFALKPGESKQLKIDRDAGGEEQVVLLDSAGAQVDVLARKPIPPTSLYNVVIYESKIVSVYTDRTKAGRGLPQEISKGLRSLGVFSLPAGDRLDDSSQIDAYRDAVAQANPGAAAHFPRP